MQRLNDWFFANDVTHVETTLDRTPKTLAESLVELALRGSDGDAWAILRSSEGADAALAELVVLYLYAADRVTAELFSMAGADAATRDLFFLDVAHQTRELLKSTVSNPEFGARFSELLDQRRSEYQRCRELCRTADETIDGTVVFAFYKHLLAFGRDTAILVLSELQLDEVEARVVQAFSSVADQLGVSTQSDALAASAN